MSMVQEEDLAIEVMEAAIALPIERQSAEQIAALNPSVVSIFGVRINNLTEPDAVEQLHRTITQYDGQARAVYFVNAHTLNLAARQPDYRSLLNRGHCVFGDGTGVRWAARNRGARMLANLNGTDLVPHLFRDTAGCGYRYFLLGATPDTIARAADSARERFEGWTLAGYHHGYINERNSDDMLQQINDAEADVLLVGMGNPLQEQWIDRHLNELAVPLCMGTGGLFDHWAGNLRRASRFVRWLGCEWVQLLLQQPHKWRRYLLGNPRFLLRMITQRKSDLAAMAEILDDREWEAVLAEGLQEIA